MDDHARALNEEGRSLWDQKAAFWDDPQLPPVMVARLRAG